MVLDDWTVCPECKFPALRSAMTAYLTSETSMCPFAVAGRDSHLFERLLCVCSLSDV
jgi:hypothetical protein